ncbi:DMT family transporter [Aquisalimonas lutea]|uniref:DMT family transporter n=1 Tax=Aquisalimonas lutea TaxID=1327750 RepID=UPI0025B567A2|nr:DMT family transporter [Aquisalimonas lutea]MDN3516166.1 DMT family transporter [Aquisalimonas lutea]
MTQAPGAVDHRRGTMLALVGVIALSFDALLVRLAMAEGATVIFWRGLLMAVSMTMVLRLWRGEWAWQCVARAGWAGWATSAGFAATLLLFVLAVLNTRVANVVVILSAAPMFAALLSGIFLREWVPPRTWVAILLCLVGIVLVFGGSVDFGGWVGDLFALGAALAAGTNFTLLRRTPGVDRMAIVAGGGAIGCLLALPFASPAAVPAAGVAALAVMGLIQMPMALGLMGEATKYLPSAEVSLFLLVETVLGTFWVWLFLGEEPPGATLLGGGLILLTLAAHAGYGLHLQRSYERRMPA